MPSIASRLIESNSNEDGSIVDEEIIKNVAGITYGGLCFCVLLEVIHLTEMTIIPFSRSRHCKATPS